jgi:hypothetical protein
MLSSSMVVRTSTKGTPAMAELNWEVFELEVYGKRTGGCLNSGGLKQLN